MKRRAYLSAVSAATIAGCTSSENPESSDNSEPSKDQNSSDGSEPSEEPDSSEDTGDTRSFNDYVTSDGVRISIDEIELGNSVTLGSDPVLEDDSKIAILVAVTVENVSEGTRNFPGRNEFNLLAGTDQYDVYTDLFGSDEIADPVSGELYYGHTDAHPGIVEEGWLIFEVPRSLTDITIAWSDSLDDSERYEWSTEIEPDQLPRVQISSVSVAEPVRVGEESKIAVSITNEGGSAGTYSADYEIDLPIESASGKIDLEIAAGKTEMWTTVIEPRGVGNGLFELAAEEVALEFTVTGALNQFGDQYQTPDPENATVTVQQPVLTEWYEYEDYDGIERVVSESGKQFGIIQIDAENQTNSSVSSFARRDISLTDGTSEYESPLFEGLGTTELLRPVEGIELHGSGISLSAGESESYVALFEIPDGIEADDLPFTAKWHLERFTDTRVTWRSDRE